MRYTYAVNKTANSSTALQMSNRAIVEHPEQMGKSEPLNTQKAQNAQNGFVHLMKTRYASLSRSGYAVHLSWVSFDF